MDLIEYAHAYVLFHHFIHSLCTQKSLHLLLFRQKTQDIFYILDKQKNDSDVFYSGGIDCTDAIR